MIEQNIIEQLLQSIADGRWSVLVGAIILIVVPIVRQLLPEFGQNTADAISAVATAIGGVGALLFAGAGWATACLVGLLVAPTSRGLIPLMRAGIRALLRKKTSADQG